jgi:hypothetical protein
MLSAEGFDQWYAIYPRKVSKKAAEKAFAKVIKAGLISESDLLAKTKAFAASKAAYRLTSGNTSSIRRRG